jgi:hypothetical protein
MRNLINCGTCGYPLTPEERATLVEQDGVMVKPAPVQSAEERSSVERGEPVAYRQTGWAAHRDHYAVPVLFNPYTGQPRDVRDVQSDPQGILIVPPGKVEMLAAKPTVKESLQVATPPAAQPAPVQEPNEWLTGCPECGMDSGCDCDSGTWNPPAAPVQEPVAWLYEAEYSSGSYSGSYFKWRVTANKFDTSGAREIKPLYTTPPNVATPLAAPVVPDVMTTAEGEHPEYVQGWNDCRQLMLQTRNNRHD